MGLYMELESGKDFKLGQSRKTVIPSHLHCLKVENRNPKGKPTSRNDLLSLDEDSRESSFSRYCSSSCKSIPSKCVGLEGDEVLKRGSIYQSSKAVRKIKELEAVDGRRKIEMLCSSDSSFSFSIVDSLCSSDKEVEHVEQKRSRVRSLNSSLNTTSVSKPYIERCQKDFLDFSFISSSSPGDVPATGVSSDGFFDIVLNLDNKDSAETLGRDSTENLKFRCDQVACPLNDGNDLLERDTVVTLRKSSSAKVGMRYSPSQSESDCSRDSPRARFRPIRKIFDPIMKSKSHRSSLGSVMEADEVTPTGITSIRRNKALRKSLLHDFSSTTQNAESGSHHIKKDYHSAVPCSLAHLHGCLKLEYRHGVPFFEFSLKCPEDVLVAETWKTDNAFNWVYTFHSNRSRKKNNASGRGFKDSHKESSMVGQMQVSCYLCSEIKDGGALDNSVVTEFVLYDIAHARNIVTAEETCNCSPDIATHSTGSKEGLDRGTLQLNNVSDLSKLKVKKNHASDRADVNSPIPYPWAPADLHPSLEIAAIVIQVPFKKRENMTYKRGDRISNKVHPRLLDLPVAEQRKKDLRNSISPAKVKVVTPTGNHGLPRTESRGPSPLLDRWRLGGGCDCGGWDMACPLIVFSNPSDEDCPLVENPQPLQLFVQGAKENIPALTITVIEEGWYAVDFHAQLSTLQAFSICVAILHGTEASIAVGQEGNQYLQNNSLKMLLIEEDVEFSTEADTEEEKRNITKTMQKIPPSFLVNPPFSPIARV